MNNKCQYLLYDSNKLWDFLFVVQAAVKFIQFHLIIVLAVASASIVRADIDSTAKICHAMLLEVRM